MRIGGKIKLGNSEITVNDVATKINSIVKFQKITGLRLDAGDTYQLNLPNNTLFIEPLVEGDGSNASGGQFIVPGEAFTYIVNTPVGNTYRGIWIWCNSNGLITISSYAHNGATVTGFRIWYIDI